MCCGKLLLNCFDRKLYLKAISRLLKQTKFSTFSQEKIKFYTDYSKMKETLDPPESVTGMKVLDKAAFKKTITVPSLTVANQNLDVCLKLLKRYCLKIWLFKPVQEAENDRKVILLNPEKLDSWNDFEKNLQEEFKKLNIQEDDFCKTCVELGYENWKAPDLLRAILPKDGLSLSGYAQIGHIIQLNLKENLLDYKQIVGEILLDKLQFARTIVHKNSIITNKYRTFDIDLICGEPDFMATVKENNCIFELDFSKVYWNPRLNTEHNRLVKNINFGDVLFDVFAGIGPFAIPAAKKKCMVYANDLNPDSFKWLNHNINLNKKCKDYIKTYNRDGGDFILNDVKEELLKIWQDKFFSGNVYVVMNLPKIAPTFMKYFKGLITEDDLRNADIKEIHLPIINCYFFNKGPDNKECFEKESGMNLDDIDHVFDFVRSVSNSNHMQKIIFTLPREYLFEKSVPSEVIEPLSKRMRTN